MTTLPEALATLDTLTCNDGSCFFAAPPVGGMRTNGGCDCIRGRPFIAPALAAVVKAARERVAQDEREAKLAEERELHERANRDFRTYWGTRR